ncbi:PIN domain-containing protein [Nocardia aurantiaca]|uniref:Uncharacterized protein n=1 Tax=Nocardia aurantiaca TaxID=2675850 RepID=A0A6I3L3L5_9NOCA|nr:hypothetical protein [Nocardia aurantiaca]MTE16171.1 hypothetical protein [Nocardia aurantiaca]
MAVVNPNAMVMALVSPAAQGDAARAAMVADDDWIAPAHMPLEVLRTLRKAVLGDRLSANDADAAFGALTAMQIEYIGTDLALLQAVWAMRHYVFGLRRRLPGHRNHAGRPLRQSGRTSDTRRTRYATLTHWVRARRDIARTWDKRPQAYRHFGDNS